LEVKMYKRIGKSAYQDNQLYKIQEQLDRIERSGPESNLAATTIGVGFTLLTTGLVSTPINWGWVIAGTITASVSLLLFTRERSKIKNERYKKYRVNL
jgi:hypothetical protein